MPFLSTLSLRRATFDIETTRIKSIISIHALLAESDTLPPHQQKRRNRISIHALLAESDSPQNTSPAGDDISIHALLAESDDFVAESAFSQRISIHALLAESDLMVPVNSNLRRNFYPRSPCGERRASHASSQSRRHFYPRSPCGERRCISRKTPVQAAFLSTLSLRRATLRCVLIRERQRVFLSTLSLRRATRPECLSGFCQAISIHALLAESDRCNWPPPLALSHFYPRSPCGERPYLDV